MSLRFALLALLTAQPMTGYDLAKAFHSSVGHVWHAPDSQIYPELRRMESQGLIEGSSVTWGVRGTKTRYDITPTGTQAFRDWINVPLEYARERNPAHLRAAYFEWAEPEQAREQLRAHIAHYSDEREQWLAQIVAIKARIHPIFARRLEENPIAEWPRITAFKLFAYEGLVSRADLEIEWAERGIVLLNASEPAG